MQRRSNPAAKPTSDGLFAQLTQLMPGVLLTVLVAALAYWLSRALTTVAISPLIVALVMGGCARNLLGVPAYAASGIKGTTRRALRAGIVLLGLQLSIGQVVSMGGTSALIVAAALAATFLMTVWLGTQLGVDSRLAKLIAAGTSICGASAVVATNTVAQAAEEDVAYAVAAVSVFGTMAVLLYPLAGQLLHMSTETYGLWVGASIHEIGQVAAAADAWQPSSDLAMVAKLSRVALLAPLVLLMATLARAPRATGSNVLRLELPWFLLGFVAMMFIGSVDVVSLEQKRWAAQATTALLSLALAGLGLELDIRKLRTRGWRPLLLGALSSAFICVTSLVGILIWK